MVGMVHETAWQQSLHQHTVPIASTYQYCVGIPSFTAACNVSLKLQGDCSNHLTLICRHSDTLHPPHWIHNGTVESGELLGTAFPGAVYTVQTLTEHTTTITGIDNVGALDGLLIQCAYNVLGNLTKSNAVKYSFIPPGQCMCCVHRIYVPPFIYALHSCRLPTSTLLGESHS